jgi:hypothetical protein
MALLTLPSPCLLCNRFLSISPLTKHAPVVYYDIDKGRTTDGRSGRTWLTIPCGCTVRSATSLPRPSSRAETKPSWPSATGNSTRPASNAPSNGKQHGEPPSTRRQQRNQPLALNLYRFNNAKNKLPFTLNQYTMLHLPAFLVLHGHFGRGQRGVRSQDPGAVVLRLGSELRLIDGEVSRTGDFQIAPVSLVPDQRLVPRRNCSRSDCTIAARAARSACTSASFTHTT